LAWVLWEATDESDRTESELHARDRYATAEKITKEFKDKQHPL